MKLGANPNEVHMASRSRKGYWRMSHNSIVQQALSNQWLKEQGVPELILPAALAALLERSQAAEPTKEANIWIKLHYGEAVRPNC